METLNNRIKETMNKSIEALKKEVSKIRTGRANTNILDGILIEYYGAKTPLVQVAAVSVPEAQQILIKPYDKSILGEIQKEITQANLGINPNTDGETIRLNFPALSEEVRKDLVKKVKATGETSKVSIRNIRRTFNDEIKKSDLTEDETRKKTDEVQKITDEYIKEIDHIIQNKEKELLTI